MFEQDTTEAIKFDAVVNEETASWIQPKENISTSVILDEPAFYKLSDLNAKTSVLGSNNKTFFSFLTEGFLNGLFQIYCAASQINLARISTDNQYSGPIPPYVINALVKKPMVIATVSKDLMMPRSKIQTDSLLGPSGAYLTWIAMEQGD